MGCVRYILFIAMYTVICGCGKEPWPYAANEILAGEKEGKLLIYIDFIPDDSLVFIYPSTYLERYLDLNGDLADDAVFIMNSYISPGNQYYSFSVKALNSHCRFVVKTLTSSNADALIDGSKIAGNLAWSDSIAILSQYSMMMQQGNHASGVWNNAGDKYLGFRYATNTDTIYGWIRANIQNNALMIIKDMAYKFPKR